MSTGPAGRSQTLERSMNRDSRRAAGMELPLSWRPVEIEPSEPSVEVRRTDRAPADRRNRALAGAEGPGRRKARTGPPRAPRGPARPEARSRAGGSGTRPAGTRKATKTGPRETAGGPVQREPHALRSRASATSQPAVTASETSAEPSQRCGRQRKSAWRWR